MYLEDELDLHKAMGLLSREPEKAFRILSQLRARLSGWERVRDAKKSPVHALKLGRVTFCGLETEKPRVLFDGKHGAYLANKKIVMRKVTTEYKEITCERCRERVEYWSEQTGHTRIKGVP